jgi:hypothetical protein
VTHEELHALLPAYAEGTLDGTTSEAVRAHLACGCLECLQEVFGRPVGLPRVAPPPASRPEPHPLPVLTAAVPIVAPRRRGLEVAVVVLALALAAVAAWTIAELRGREATYRAQAAATAAQLAEAEAARRELVTRGHGLERDLAGAEAEAARQAEAVRETAEASARLQTELDAARERIATLTRGLRRRDSEIDRLLQSFDDERALRGLLATPGMEVLPLKPVAPFRDVRGQALWHPGRDTVLVYAFGLPPLATRSTYRVRVALDDGQEVPGPAFRVDTRSDIAIPVRIEGNGARLREIQVVIDPAAQPVLAGRRGASG